jgi:NAD(P)-dependent dehydrogenase (short-subunit alcohol dehydrogenase family)
MKFPLEQQTVVLTGAAQGLGAAIARHFATLGANLVLFDNNAKGLAETVASCDGRAKGVTADLASADDTARAIEEGLSAVPQVDTLIHNAAILKPEPFSDLSHNMFRATLDVGIQAAFQLTKAVWDGMVDAGGGALIYVSSRSGIEGFADEVAYCSAKHALEGFSKSLALEGEPHGIVSATITPGMYMRTPMSETTYPEELRRKWVEPDVLAPAFSLIAQRRPKEFNGQRLDAWQLVQA